MCLLVIDYINQPLWLSLWGCVLAQPCWPPSQGQPPSQFFQIFYNHLWRVIIQPNMPKFNQEIENRILKAIDMLQHQNPPNIPKTAWEFNLNQRTLNACFQGRGSLTTQSPTNIKLSHAQNHALCCYINTLDELGVYPQPRMLENCANSLLQLGHKENTPPPTVGDKWLKWWLKRHPQYIQQ